MGVTNLAKRLISSPICRRPQGCLWYDLFLPSPALPLPTLIAFFSPFFISKRFNFSKRIRSLDSFPGGWPELWVSYCFKCQVLKAEHSNFASPAPPPLKVLSANLLACLGWDCLASLLATFSRSCNVARLFEGKSESQWPIHIGPGKGAQNDLYKA